VDTTKKLQSERIQKVITWSYMDNCVCFKAEDPLSECYRSVWHSNRGSSQILSLVYEVISSNDERVPTRLYNYQM